MKPTPNIDDTFSLFLQDETHRLVGVQPNSAPPAEMACVVTQSNAKGKPTRKDKPFCSHCNIHGHTKEKCFKIHGYPPSFNKSGNTSVANNSVNNILEAALGEQSQSWSQQQCQKVLALLQAQMAQLPGASQQDSSDTASIETIGMPNSTLNSLFKAPNAWIVDSGATTHITCFLEFLFNFKFLKNKLVLLPNGTRVQVVGTGSVRINSRIVLHNVLYIPSFHVNLISVPKITPNYKIGVLFEDTFVLFQDT